MWLPSVTVEPAVLAADNKRTPFAHREAEDLSCGVLAITDDNLRSRQARDLHAIAAVDAHGTFSPVGARLRGHQNRPRLDWSVARSLRVSASCRSRSLI